MTRKRSKQNPRTGRAVSGNTHQKSIENAARDLSNQKVAIQLTTRGVPMSEIAEHLGVTPDTVRRLINKGMEEYYDDHMRVAQNFSAKNLARYDMMMRTWLPRALGGKSKQTVTDPITGKTQDVVIDVEPSAEAAHICLTAMRDLSRHLGNGQALRLEHSGANGGPLITASVDQMEAARLVRESFGGNAAKTPGASNGSSLIVKSAAAIVQQAKQQEEDDDLNGVVAGADEPGRTLS